MYRKRWKYCIVKKATQPWGMSINFVNRKKKTIIVSETWSILKLQKWFKNMSWSPQPKVMHYKFFINTQVCKVFNMCELQICRAHCDWCQWEEEMRCLYGWMVVNVDGVNLPFSSFFKLKDADRYNEPTK